MTQRKRRARRLARRISLLASLVTVAVFGLRQPLPESSRLWLGIGGLATYLLTYFIVMKVTMEFLPD